MLSSTFLEEAGFDAYVEGLCAVFYAARMGRPSLRPGRYFRMLFIGYFEGLSSERGIAWRVADSLSLRSAEETEHRREVIEAALAHVVGNKVEAAYARSDLFDRRRTLMDDWGGYIEGPTARRLNLEFAAIQR